MPTSVAVVVAHPIELVREIFDAGLGSPLEVVGTAGSLAQLLSMVGELRPAVAVTAADFDDGSLIDVVAQVISAGTRVLVVSERTNDDSVSKLLLAGASGLLFMRDASISEIAQAVEAVAAGRTALHPDVALAVFEQWRAMRANDARKVTADEVTANEGTATKISSREADVLGAVARGLTTREIGRSLGIAEKTVEAHKSRLYAKLGAKNQAHALALASDLGLIAL